MEDILIIFVQTYVIFIYTSDREIYKRIFIDRKLRNQNFFENFNKF